MNSSEMLQPVVFKGIKEVSQEEWEKFFLEFKALRSRVYRKIKTLEESAREPFLKKFLTDSREIYMNVPDKVKYAVYHICVAGSTNHSISPSLDFEGEKSMWTFFENLEKEVDAALEEQNKD